MDENSSGEQWSLFSDQDLNLPVNAEAHVTYEIESQARIPMHNPDLMMDFSNNSNNGETFLLPSIQEDEVVVSSTVEINECESSPFNSENAYYSPVVLEEEQVCVDSQADSTMWSFSHGNGKEEKVEMHANPTNENELIMFNNAQPSQNDPILDLLGSSTASDMELSSDVEAINQNEELNFDTGNDCQNVTSSINSKELTLSVNEAAVTAESNIETLAKMVEKALENGQAAPRVSSFPSDYVDLMHNETMAESAVSTSSLAPNSIPLHFNELNQYTDCIESSTNYKALVEVSKSDAIEANLKENSLAIQELNRSMGADSNSEKINNIVESSFQSNNAVREVSTADCDLGDLLMSTVPVVQTAVPTSEIISPTTMPIPYQLNKLNQYSDSVVSSESSDEDSSPLPVDLKQESTLTQLEQDSETKLAEVNISNKDIQTIPEKFNLESRMLSDQLDMCQKKETSIKEILDVGKTRNSAKILRGKFVHGKCKA